MPTSGLLCAVDTNMVGIDVRNAVTGHQNRSMTLSAIRLLRWTQECELFVNREVLLILLTYKWPNGTFLSAHLPSGGTKRAAKEQSPITPGMCDICCFRLVYWFVLFFVCTLPLIPNDGAVKKETCRCELVLFVTLSGFGLSKWRHPPRSTVDCHWVAKRINFMFCLVTSDARSGGICSLQPAVGGISWVRKCVELWTRNLLNFAMIRRSSSVEQY